MKSIINEFSKFLIQQNLLDNPDKFIALVHRNKGDIDLPQKMVFALADFFKSLTIDQCYGNTLNRLVPTIIQPIHYWAPIAAC